MEGGGWLGPMAVPRSLRRADASDFFSDTFYLTQRGGANGLPTPQEGSSTQPHPPSSLQSLVSSKEEKHGEGRGGKERKKEEEKEKGKKNKGKLGNGWKSNCKWCFWAPLVKGGLSSV